MKKKVAKKIHMFNTVQNICRKHKNSWRYMPGFKGAFQEFESELFELEKVGKTADVSQYSPKNIIKRKDFVHQLLLIHAGLEKFGLDNGLLELSFRNKVDFNEFLALDEKQLFVHLTTLKADLLKYNEELSFYGLDEKAIEYTIIGIDQIRSDFTHQTENVNIDVNPEFIEKIIQNMEDNLNVKMDQMVSLFKNYHPHFYSQYFTARREFNSTKKVMAM